MTTSSVEGSNNLSISVSGVALHREESKKPLFTEGSNADRVTRVIFTPVSLIHGAIGTTKRTLEIKQAKHDTPSYVKTAFKVEIFAMQLAWALVATVTVPIFFTAIVVMGVLSAPALLFQNHFSETVNTPAVGYAPLEEDPELSDNGNIVLKEIQTQLASNRDENQMESVSQSIVQKYKNENKITQEEGDLILAKVSGKPSALQPQSQLLPTFISLFTREEDPSKLVAHQQKLEETKEQTEETIAKANQDAEAAYQTLSEIIESQQTMLGYLQSIDQYIGSYDKNDFIQSFQQTVTGQMVASVNMMVLAGFVPDAFLVKMPESVANLLAKIKNEFSIVRETKNSIEKLELKLTVNSLSDAQGNLRLNVSKQQKQKKELSDQIKKLTGQVEKKMKERALSELLHVRSGIGDEVIPEVDNDMKTDGE